MRTLGEIFSVACAHGVFLSSRFGLRSGKTVVYQPRGTANAPDSTTHELARPVEEGSHGTAAQLSGDWVTGDAARMDFREDLGTDWLRVVVDRTEVEALDVSRTAAILSRVVADRKAVERHRERVDLAFHGYSNDPRELYDIPEVRDFCAKLDDAFPYWFYFLSTEGVTLGVIACCLCSVTKLRPGVVSFGPDLLQFMTRHFEALNWLFDNYSLDERHNVEVSGNVAEYFSKFEPWVVSDFSLIDAIEAGVVKVPRVPVVDDSMTGEQPTYRDLWLRIREQLPGKGRKTDDVGGDPKLPVHAHANPPPGGRSASIDPWREGRRADEGAETGSALLLERRLRSSGRGQGPAFRLRRGTVPGPRQLIPVRSLRFKCDVPSLAPRR